eukprot:m.168862 g.168862  ORF g.168862 m.168862 type:complete len:213 (-) comp16468_c7_seq1:1685-2323(-)
MTFRTTTLFLPDGTIILQDGSKILPDGTRTFANGLQLRADGAWVDADGNVITDADRIAELNQAYGTMPLRPDTTQSIRSNFLGSARSRMSPPDSLASTQRRSASRLGQGQSSNMNASSRHGGERDNNSGTKSDPLSSVVEVDADNTRSLPPSRRMHWDFDSEASFFYFLPTAEVRSLVHKIQTCNGCICSSKFWCSSSSPHPRLLINHRKKD